MKEMSLLISLTRFIKNLLYLYEKGKKKKKELTIFIIESLAFLCFLFFSSGKAIPFYELAGFSLVFLSFLPFIVYIWQ